jgi:hypothetical protein
MGLFVNDRSMMADGEFGKFIERSELIFIPHSTKYLELKEAPEYKIGQTSELLSIVAARCYIGGAFTLLGLIFDGTMRPPYLRRLGFWVHVRLAS